MPASDDDGLVGDQEAFYLRISDTLYLSMSGRRNCSHYHHIYNPMMVAPSLSPIKAAKYLKSHRSCTIRSLTCGCAHSRHINGDTWP